MYINTETLQYPVSENWIRKNAPNTSFTEDFTPPAPFKAVKATINNLDFNPITQRIEQSFPENRGGEWFQTWNVVDKYATKEEADKAILDNLNDTKITKNLEINTERLKANNSWFVFLDSRIACDQLSREDIQGVNGHVSNTGSLPDSWPGGWKHMDNGYVPIVSVETWKMLYAAMVNQGLANFQKAQTLKQRVIESATVQEVNAIKWEE